MTKIKDSSTNKENRDILEDNCPEIYAINLIRGQWILSIFYHLKNKRQRFSDLKESIPKVTDRMLSMQLKSMENNQLIHRYVYPEVPVRVEYELTEIGKNFLPILNELEAWGRLHKEYSMAK